MATWLTQLRLLLAIGRNTTHHQEKLLSALGAFWDVPAKTLGEPLELARVHAQQASPHPGDIREGSYYSNGRLGNQWRFRQVIDAADT